MWSQLSPNFRESHILIRVLIQGGFSSMLSHFGPNFRESYILMPLGLNLGGSSSMWSLLGFSILMPFVLGGSSSMLGPNIREFHTLISLCLYLGCPSSIWSLLGPNSQGFSILMPLGLGGFSSMWSQFGQNSRESYILMPFGLNLGCPSSMWSLDSQGLVFLCLWVQEFWLYVVPVWSKFQRVLYSDAFGS